MIDKLAKDADSLVYLPEPRYDMQLLEAMKQVIAEDPEHDLLIILHCYGSHFTYHQRYPREFARFLPDDNVAINRKNVEKLVNAYDNSIYYTDHFLSQTIEYLRSLENDCSALLYCADHGEDILDDERERFLHASPTTTFYQLYVANLGWFFAGISTGIPGKSRSGPQQRIRTGHNPLHVSKHGRYRFDRRRLHRSGLLVGQSDIRLPGTAPLSERSQPGRSFPENRPVG